MYINPKVTSLSYQKRLSAMTVVSSWSETLQVQADSRPYEL